MYSVEDLLISHGYKVPQRNSNNVPVSHSSSLHPATYEKCLPTRSDSRCEIAEKRKGQSGVNGYEGDHVYSSGGIRQAPARGFPGDAENRVRKQRTQDVDNGNLADGRLPEDSLTTDSGWVVLMSCFWPLRLLPCPALLYCCCLSFFFIRLFDLRFKLSCMMKSVT